MIAKFLLLSLLASSTTVCLTQTLLDPKSECVVNGSAVTSIASILDPCNPGCYCDSFCSKILAISFQIISENLRGTNTTVFKGSSNSPIASITVFFPDNFNISLVGYDCCKLSCNKKSRDESFITRVDNVKTVVEINDLKAFVINLSGILSTLTSSVDELIANNSGSDSCPLTEANEPGLANRPSSCNLFDLLELDLLDEPLTGNYSTTIANVQAYTYLTAVKKGKWTVHKGEIIYKDQITYPEFTCKGGPLFRKICKCLLGTALTESLITAIAGTNTVCKMQAIYNGPYQNFLRCHKFKNTPCTDKF